MGTTYYTDKEIEELLLRLSDEFTGPSYNLLTRNCNHFTEEFVSRLTKKTVPTWINRAAKLGNMFPCVVPWEWIQPPELAEEAEQEVAEEEREHSIVEEEEESRHHRSRRSSTISLLSSSYKQNSSYHNNSKSSYHSISQHTTEDINESSRNHSQEKLLNGHLYHPPISKFQGILLDQQEEEE